MPSGCTDSLPLVAKREGRCSSRRYITVRIHRIGRTAAVRIVPIADRPPLSVGSTKGHDRQKTSGLYPWSHGIGADGRFDLPRTSSGYRRSRGAWPRRRARASGNRSSLAASRPHSSRSEPRRRVGSHGWKPIDECRPTFLPNWRTSVSPRSHRLRVARPVPRPPRPQPQLAPPDRTRQAGSAARAKPPAAIGLRARRARRSAASRVPSLRHRSRFRPGPCAGSGASVPH